MNWRLDRSNFRRLAVAFVEENGCHYEFNSVFYKSCNVFCAKSKEVKPDKLNFSMTNKCFDSTEICY